MKRLIQGVIAWLLVMCGALQASELSERLSGAQHVLLMRHAYAPGVGDPPGYSLDQCESQRILNDEGKQQSVRIGQWLRSQGVEKATVYSSVWCRCQQTAERLGLGPVTIEPTLASFFENAQRAADQNKRLQAFIAQSLKSKGDRPLILVTHHVNIRAFMGRDVGSGDMVLARVNAQGQMLDFSLYPSP
jgi:broad specificity phosphatase PhoE